MTKWIKSAYFLVILVASAMIMNAPSLSLAQNNQPAQIQPGSAARQVPQPVGGVATVVGVDQPDNCLRIRSGPGGSYEVIGCAGMGQQLNITGVWTSNNWAQLSDNGWVYGPQIQTDLRPPQEALAPAEGYAEPDYSDYPVTYSSDPYYLPDYGYSTYWYGGIPLFLYNANVWRRYHPWWWQNGHRVWNQGHYNKWAPYVKNGAHRNFLTNRSNVWPSHGNRFNAGGNTARTWNNTIRPGRTFSGAGPARTFSSPNLVRGGTNLGARSFNRAGMTVSRGIQVGGSRSFSRASVGAGRSFSGGGMRSAAHFGGGGRRR